MLSYRLAVAAALVASCGAWAPRSLPRASPRVLPASRAFRVTPRAVLPASELADAPALLHSALTTTMQLADAAAAVPAADAAAATGGGGPIDSLAGVIAGCIKYTAKTLEGVGVQNGVGPSIVLFTLLVKGITFPLNYQQISSTTKMQAIQPRTKEIQAQYKDDPNTMNMMIQQLYQENDINPLAGCLPSLAQIPIFIALYRSLLNLAKENALDEPFLWLPNLEGPTYGAQNADWLFKWTDGAPTLGWTETLAFLTLPIILVVSQKASMKLLQPPQAEPQNEQMAMTQSILEYLPFMIGFFALNVPSGLAIYWVINNFISTASTLAIKSAVGTAPATAGAAGGAAAVASSAPPPSAPSQPTSFAEMMANAPAKSAPKPAPVIDVEPVAPRAPEPVAAAEPVAAGGFSEASTMSAADAEFAAQTKSAVAAAPPPSGNDGAASSTAQKKQAKAAAKAKGKKRKR